MSVAHTDKAELEYGAEIWRKLLHLFALTMPIGYHLVDRSVSVRCGCGTMAVRCSISVSRS